MRTIQGKFKQIACERFFIIQDKLAKQDSSGKALKQTYGLETCSDIYDYAAVSKLQTPLEYKRVTNREITL